MNNSKNYYGKRKGNQNDKKRTFSKMKICYKNISKFRGNISIKTSSCSCGQS